MSRLQSDKRLIEALIFSTLFHLAAFALIKPGSAPLHAGHVILTVNLKHTSPSKLAAAYLEQETYQEVPAPPAPAAETPISENIAESPAQTTPPQTDSYFRSSEVDVPSYPTYLEPLIYPEQAFQQHVSGRVRLRIYIDELGDIDSVSIVESEPLGIFDDAALQAVLASRFRPAVAAGRFVKSQKLIEIDFDPNESTESPSGQANTVAP